ncbi:hypothetical protein [Nostoc sp. UHCC 0251]|uniref:hypothetical protein n=1 Tax=Nostoc sp. UHCC 0251 TaxID=3110240 RepID=UPI002B1EB7E8|nr:hypothetical protein [Nostoc sp. UHCC 0251]MEA5622615.1 hypothetical protein [Nostoc sp. UHCC 0251]
MLSQNLIQNLPAILGFLLPFSWLLYTSLLVAYELDLIEKVTIFLSTKKVILPSLATLTLPFLFTYFYQEIPIVIDKWRLRDFVGIFGAVIGAILGFFISEFRQWKTQGEQISTVRTMLKFEINQDLMLLAEFKDKANTSITNKSQFIRETPLPQWNRTVWKSQVLFLPLALTEKEINKIYELYTELDKITQIYSLLIEQVSELSGIGIINYSDGLNDAYKSTEAKSLRNKILQGWENLNSRISEIIKNDSFKKIL